MLEVGSWTVGSPTLLMFQLPTSNFQLLPRS